MLNYFKYSLLDRTTADETPLDNVEGGGSLTFDTDALRVTGSVTVANINSLPVDPVLRISVVTDDTTTLVATMRGSFSKYTVEGAHVYGTLELESLLSYLQDDAPLMGYTAKAGTDVAEEVTRIVEFYGLRANIPSIATTLGTDYASTDDDYLTICNTLLEAVGMEDLDVEPDGTIVTKAYVEPQARAIVYTYDTDEGARMLPSVDLTVSTRTTNVLRVNYSTSAASMVSIYEDTDSVHGTQTTGCRVVALEDYKGDDVDQDGLDEYTRTRLLALQAEDSTATITNEFTQAYKRGDVIRVYWHSIDDVFVDVTGVVTSIDLDLSTGMQCETTLSVIETETEE